MTSIHHFFVALIAPFSLRPIHLEEHPEHPSNPLFSHPLLAPLLLPNTASTTRDHLANERTFLSWLRLSIYLSIVSIAIILSFHLRSAPTSVEKKIALPLGLVFWFLSLACLVSGAANYANTVVKYERRAALVQSGWKTQLVFTVVACAIVAACVVFLSTNAQSSK